MLTKGDIPMSEKIYGIDMGTNSIKIYQKAAGVILHQKNMIAMVKKKEPLALGDEAYSMYEKAPKNIEVKQPIINGVIADFTAMQTMIQLYFKGMHGKKFAEGLAAGGNAEFYIAVPSDITEVEKRAFYDLIASSSLKTKKIRIVEKPIADALGAGLDVMDATGRLIVNIGADTTEISLISLGGIVQSRLLKIGGTKFDEAIQQTVKKKHNLVIGMKSAERLKMQLASGIKEDEEITYDVMGRNLITGLPNKVIKRANAILKKLNAADITKKTKKLADEAKEASEEMAVQIDMFNVQETQIIDEINKIDVMALTPIQALQTLFDLQNKIKGM